MRNTEGLANMTRSILSFLQFQVILLASSSEEVKEGKAEHRKAT